MVDIIEARMKAILIILAILFVIALFTGVFKAMVEGVMKLTIGTFKFLVGVVAITIIVWVLLKVPALSPEVKSGMQRLKNNYDNQRAQARIHDDTATRR